MPVGHRSFLRQPWRTELWGLWECPKAGAPAPHPPQARQSEAVGVLRGMHTGWAASRPILCREHRGALRSLSEWSGAGQIKDLILKSEAQKNQRRPQGAQRGDGCRHIRRRAPRPLSFRRQGPRKVHEGDWYSASRLVVLPR